MFSFTGKQKRLVHFNPGMMLNYLLIVLFGCLACNDGNTDLLDRNTGPEAPADKVDTVDRAPGALPNIILFVADDLGWTDLGVQGSDFYESPTIDRLAEDGIRFTNAYANASNCAPTRASLISGLYSPRHGVYTVNSSARGRSVNRKLIPTPNTKVLDPKFFTLPEALKEAGYMNCMAGKWHLSDDPRPYGFDVNYGGYHKGSPNSYFSPYNNPALSDGPSGEHLPARLAKDVSSWIEDHRDTSFFVYMPFYSVHTPIQARKDLTNKYAGKADGVHHDHDEYAAMVEAMDLAIAQVLSKVEELGLSENTVIVFTSDNGQFGPVSSSRPLRGSKGMYYEGGIRVPMFIKWPGKIQPGTVSDEPVISLDIYPTLMNIVNDQVPAGLDGESLLPILEGGMLNARSLFWHFPAYLDMKPNDRAFDDAHAPPHWRSTPCSVIRDGDWKLIEYFETGELELFNLANDIGEKENLSEMETGMRDALYSKLVQWREDTNAPVPTEPNPDFKE